MYKNTDFPQYRKLSNGKSYYKILNDRTFEELVIFGSKCLFYTTHAEKYPEILRIMDMLNCEVPFELVTSDEYDSILNAKPVSD
jgi:hypothetical protein